MRVARPARLVGGVVATLVAALVAAGCSPGDGAAPASTTTAAVVQGTILQVEQLVDAVAAVESARGGPQRYVELNATPDGVNVFVAVDEQNEVAYFVRDGVVEAPGSPAPQSSAPFELAGVDLGLGATLVQQTQDRFPGATVVSVALLDVPDQGLRWAVRSRSALGGLLNAFYTTAGDLVSVSPA